MFEELKAVKWDILSQNEVKIPEEKKIPYHFVYTLHDIGELRGIEADG